MLFAMYKKFSIKNPKVLMFDTPKCTTIVRENITFTSEMETFRGGKTHRMLPVMILTCMQEKGSPKY